MNDEMFRQALIELMNLGLLNEFVNEVFEYNLKEKEYVYMQYKIVKGNIVLNIYDNVKENRFKGYIFSTKHIDSHDDGIIYVDVEDCYQKYKKGNINNKLSLIGVLLKASTEDEKKKIIDKFENDDIKKILIKHFI